MPKPLRSFDATLTALLLALLAMAGCRGPAPSTPSPQPPTPGLAVSPAVRPTTPQATPITPSPDPTRQPPASLTVPYTVRNGDTLSGIAAAFGSTVEELLRLNGLTDADSLAAGQQLRVPIHPRRTGPADKLIPDSELVYGPAFAAFDVAEATAGYPGWFNQYAEQVDGRWRSSAEIVQLIAQRYSVGPRLLLALLELRSGWLTNPDPPPQARLYPLGYDRPGWEGLFAQLSWAADALNDGFYGWRRGDLWTVRLADGEYVRLATSLNAGTVGLQEALRAGVDYAGWTALLAPDGFLAVYRALFGDPFAYAVEPLLPPDLTQPPLALPWSEGETWYYTGGPHGGWGEGSARAAVDFIPPGEGVGCYPSAAWVTAAAPGLVVRSENGEVVVDLDGDGFEGTGWSLLYMHVGSRDRVAAGTWVQTGDPIGHPSCEGGIATATHVHLARRYNGVWIPAGRGPLPMVLDGWQVGEGEAAYEGTMRRDGVIKQACQCREAGNGIRR